MRGAVEESAVPTIIGRAPSRVSLAGGGTDLPQFYERHGGAVVSFAIDLYAYGQASARVRDLELVSIDTGSREIVTQAQFARRVRPPILAETFLQYQKAVAWHFGIDCARLASTSEIPPGAGLASSGAVCVALVQAAASFAGQELARADIADRACAIEMDLLRHGCGKQDQYASAFGGVNLLTFDRDGRVGVAPLRITPDVAAALERRLVLFHDGGKRSASGPLHEQGRRSESDQDTIRALHELKEMAFEMRRVLEAGDVDAVGPLLDRAWTTKQHLSTQVSTPDIARVYALAKEAGATGGKLSGAGLAGTLVLFCPEAAREEVRRSMEGEGWRARSVKIDWEGVTVDAQSGETS